MTEDKPKSWGDEEPDDKNDDSHCHWYEDDCQATLYLHLNMEWWYIVTVTVTDMKMIARLPSTST